MRGRGLKRYKVSRRKADCPVAPRAGAWIETHPVVVEELVFPVAPRAGAWIETSIPLPSALQGHVAPRAGAWIETAWDRGVKLYALGCPSCGGVD